MTTDNSVLNDVVNGQQPTSPLAGPSTSLMPESPQDFEQATAPTSGRVSPWRSILQGALLGMQGAAQPTKGRGSFAQGVGMGVTGEIQGEQRQIENQQRQQQLNFESAQAANEMIAAQARARQEDMASKLTQAQIDSLNANTQAYLQDHGIKPNVTVQGSTPDEIQASASGALGTLSQQNDGKVPRVATFGSPIGVGENPDTHSVVAYHANQQPGADKRAVIDDYLLATRGLPSTDSEWQSGFGKVAPGEDIPAEGLISRNARTIGQDAKFVDAMQFRQVPAVPSRDGRIDIGAAESLQQTLQQQADNYAKLPGAKPAYAAFLQQKADAFKSLTRDSLVNEAELTNRRIAQEETARQQAMEPFKQKEREFQAGVTLNTELAKDANTKNQTYWADPQHGYAATLQQTRTANASIDAAKDGNGLLTSFAPTMAVLGINVSAGVHRISPAEAQAAAMPGGFAERFNAWFDKAASGKLSPQLTQEAHQLMGILQDSAYQKALSQSQMAAASGKIPVNVMPAMTPEGKITTLDKAIPPQGADVRVPGPGGKMYWGNSRTRAIIGPAE
ncbi:MAG TPA: hypothetical protein VFB23_08905 [Candidatus Acidoferrales bacterium]|nr:hypothetical protein [Candidatus Acidoferrales bacterium]